ncbi:MAG: thiamine-phosphate kinase [Pseudanabaenaceae cyanobacterium bins.39]|nr:thiamine-phosphate kinase [Pseudanabaenaceae cyanobacterium bins.39]
MTNPNTPRVTDIGERGLLKILQQYCGEMVGDDAAPMGATLPDRQMVVTTDMLIDGVHFSDRTTSAEDVGWRAVAVNLSDLAAMGAQPWGLVIALGLPPETPVSWVEGVYRGMAACMQTYGTQLVGGDTVRSPIKTLSITAFGQVDHRQIIQRHRARVGDAIVITGEHGLSRAGLELLSQNSFAIAGQKMDLHKVKELYPHLVTMAERSHQRPIPRFDAITLLQDITQEYGWDWAIAGMDSSDGLADAITQICQASQVDADIDWSAISIPEIVQILAGDRARDWVLYGGEDFELVLFMPMEIAIKFVERMPSAMIIGRAIAKPNHDSASIAGLEMRSTFQHFGTSISPI